MYSIRAHVHVSACLVGVFYSEIHSFSIFCAFRVYFLHLSGTFSKQYIRTVPWNAQEIFWVSIEQCWMTDKTILFHLCIHVGFFFAFVVLTEHCSGCPQTQKSSVTFHGTDNGQCIVYFIFQMIFRFHLSSKRSALLSFLKTIYIDFYLGRYSLFFKLLIWKIKYIYNKILFCP